MKHLILPIICLSCSKDNDENTDNNTPSVKTSLPVKVTRKNAGGTIISTITITYDAQKRINKMIYVDQNTSLNQTQTFS